MKKLVIAEKPSVAQTVAKALGVSEKGKGCIEGDDYVVTWCYGHMLEFRDDPRYAKWNMDDLPIIPETWRYEPIPSPQSKEQLRNIISLINRKDITGIVCATDAGREGELIFRLVYNYSKTKKPAERLWVSSLEEASVREGFRKLRPSSEYDNLYMSALARSEADWIVGINATRFYTIAFRSEGGGKPLTVGRVQTPTLQMILDRDAEIKSFVSKESWQTALLFGTWTLQSQKMEKESDAEALKAAVEGKPVKITAVEEKDRKQSPPLLYSLTSLQMDANRTLGFSAEHTLEIAQALYEKKMLSYPRTDAEYLTSDMERTFVSVVESLKPVFYPELRMKGARRLIDDSKVSDHYALMVTKHFADTVSKEDASVLTKDEKSIANLVVKRMLQAVSPWHEWHETKVTGVSADTEFTGSGRREIDPGWTAIGKKAKADDDGKSAKGKKDDAAVFPEDIAIGKEYIPESVEIRKRKTEPPKPYTEETLLGAMEKAGSKDMPDDAERKGLGTSATRASIIEGLVSKAYIYRDQKGKTAYLIPTDKARFLSSVIKAELKDPKMTAEWEWRLKSIQEGKDTEASFIKDISGSITTLIRDGKNDPAIKEHNAASQTGRYIGICPFCGSPVMAFAKYAVCQNKECGTKVWRDNRRLNGHTLTDDELKALFEGKWVPLRLKSERTGKSYMVEAHMTDEKYTYTGKDGKEASLFSFDTRFLQRKEPHAGSRKEL